MKRWFLFALALGIMAFAGSPLHASVKNPPAVAFDKLLIGIKPGTKIGEAYQAVTKAKLADIYVEDAFTAVGKKAQKALFCSILKDAGYKVAGEEDLFNRSDAKDAQYLLGGKIIGETYSRAVSILGFKIEQSYRIEWQLFDTAAEKVVFSAVTSGTKTYKLKTSTENLDVMGESLKKLLLEPEFSKILKA